MISKRITPEQAAELARRDKRRLVLMAVGVVVLGIAYFMTSQRARDYTEEHGEIPGPEDEPTEQVAIPLFGGTQTLAAVRDAGETDRAAIDGQALDALLEYAALFAPAHYDAYGIRDWTPAVAAEVAANTTGYRNRPFRVRGELTSVNKRRRSEDRHEEFAGTLRLADGSGAHFVVREIPTGLEIGDELRVDGLFLKLFRRETKQGWGEGPLIVGSAASRSYPPVDLSGPLPLDALASVRDDSLEERTGLPFQAQWQLMAWAAADGQGQVDWDAAPELDGQILGELSNDGDAYRGKPFRVGISRNMASWVESVGENPLRLDRITVGWIGNQFWKGAVPLIQYMGPFEKPELSERYGAARLLEARGFFFKNMTYAKPSGDLGRVPVFVMQSVDIFTPSEDFLTRNLMWAVTCGAVAMCGLIWFLLLRDRRKTAELQRELVRRRQARRSRVSES